MPWLMKTEPSTFGIEDLAKAPKRTAMWDGVRNYQARNMIRDEMKKGDRALLYHSSCEVPGVAGVMRIVREAYPDPTAFDRKNKHYDAGSDPRSPRWFVVDVQLERRFDRVITLEELKAKNARALADFALLKRGNRLSVMPVSDAQYDYILSIE